MKTPTRIIFFFFVSTLLALPIDFFVGNSRLQVAFAKSGNWSTHMNSFSGYKDKPKIINPAIEIPRDESLKWKTSSTINGQETGENKGAPAYNYSALGGWSWVGFVPEGTSIDLVHVKGKSKIHYYSMTKPDNFIPRERGGDKKTTKKRRNKNLSNPLIWIPGSYIIPQ